MPILSPNDRYAVIGKTGSGKTTLSAVLAAMLVPHDSPRWEAWWIDSKLDPRDGKMLRDWGFGRTKARKHFPLKPEGGPAEWQAQELCAKAMARGDVLVIIDEYKHVTFSTRRAGPGIEAVHLRGRGLNVGLLGQSQEPVEIPRQLVSQSTHVILADLSYPADIKYARSLYEGYMRPPDRHGFYYAHIDGAAKWRYYPHVRAFHQAIMGDAEQTG